MNGSKVWLAVCAVVGLLASTANAVVNIETVRVGDPGNAADTRYATPGYGAVSYTYNIGKYEVTAGQYTEFLNKVAVTDAYGLYNSQMPNGSGILRIGTSGSYTYRVDTAFVNRPVNYVSFWDACRFANWLSNGQPAGAQDASTTEQGTYSLGGYNGTDGRTIQRNPGSKWAVTSEDEWYKSAYYKGGSMTAGYWNYPTGSDTVPGWDLDDASGNNANCYGDTLPIQWPYFTTVVGEFQNSESPYGTFDQGGNVWEWNEAVTHQTATYAYRGLRGGTFVANGNYQHASIWSHGYPEGETYYTGFRVCNVPEPATLTLLALGGLLVSRRRV